MSLGSVTHLSSHHTSLDNRVFQRECRTLADAGYDVSFVVRNPAGDEVRDGVQILAVKTPKSRLERVTLTAFEVIRRGLSTKAKVYHFHDPELIPWGFLLRLMGKTVVYDVHEDFGQAAGVRSWIPKGLRGAVAGLYNTAAKASASAFNIVIAERYYARTFPNSTPVLNYPHLERSAFLRNVKRSAAPTDQIRMIYTGSVTEARGALLHAKLAQMLPGSHLHFSGHTPPDVARLVREASGDATIGICREDGTIDWEKRSTRPAAEVSTIVMDGVGFYVSDRMLEAYAEPWTAALALFPLSEHYYEKELTKFFEYMAAGLPIISSNFPNWAALIEPDQCGIAVDPADLEEAARQIRWLHEDRKEAVAMGERGRAASQAKFSWPSQQQNLLDLYSRLVPQACA